MIANVQAVQMKNSGVPWIGEIPDYWSVIAVKRVASVFVPQRNKPELNEETGYPWITLDEVGLKFVAQSGKGLLVSKDALREAGSKVLEAGAVITGCVGTFGTASITRTALVINQQLQAYIPKKINAEFLRFCILNSSAYFESVATSTTISYVNREGFADLFIPLPSIEEQKTIAQFLDRKTAAIDALIAKKQRLIELLEEKRSALINQAVTKGLNSDAPMKDSGIPWIGEIPEHWIVKRFKYLSKMKGGYAFNSKEFTDSGVQVIKIANLYQNELCLEREPTFLPHEYLDNFPSFIVNKGDILMSLTGTLGKRDYGFAVFIDNDNKFFLNQRVGRLKISKDLHSEYALYLLRSEAYLNQLFSQPFGTKQANLSDYHVLSPYVAFPEKEEQERILRFIRSESSQINQGILKVHQQIELLQEYRQSVITAAVTGKLDVTQAATP